MKAVTWQGKRDIRVETVPDPQIKGPDDVIVRVTSTGLCGIIPLAGVYGGVADPLPLLQMFDKQIQMRMGQANVWNWVPAILPLLTDGDPLGVEGFATHVLPLTEAPRAYEMFQKKQDDAVKVVFQP